MKTSSLATVQIKDLLLNVVIGTLPHERDTHQDVLVNVEFVYDASFSLSTDALGHAVDYAVLYDKIMLKAGATCFFLLERLAAFILELVMEDEKILSATVRLEKKGVFEHARSVVVSLSADKGMGALAKDIKTTRCY